MSQDEGSYERHGQLHASLLAGLEAMEAGFAVFDRDLRLVFANGAFSAHFGGSAALFPGVSLRFLAESVERMGRVDHPDGRRDWITALIRGQGECALRQRPDGRVIRWSARYGDGGTLTGQSHDVTEELRLQSVPERARALAEGADTARAEYLVRLGDQLRKPLGAVVNMASQLRDGGTNDPRLLADAIRNSAEAAMDIAEDALGHATGAAMVVPLQDRPFDLENVIAGILGRLQSEAMRVGVRLRMVVDPLMNVWRKGDPGFLRHLLLNVVGNALKFGQNGQVTLRLMPWGRGISLSVEDEGPGIPDELIDEAFQEFVRLDPNRDCLGMGLGLPVAARLADAMGGRLWVHDGDAGACFTVNLPLPEVQNQAAPQPSPLRVLAVGLGPEIRREWLRRLQVLNCQPRMVATTKDALHALQDGQGADLLLMPGDHGPAESDSDLLQAIRPNLPVILLEHASAVHGANRTALHFPIRQVDLADALARAVQDRPDQPPPVSRAGRELSLLAVLPNARDHAAVRQMLAGCAIGLLTASEHEGFSRWQAERPDIMLLDMSSSANRGAVAAMRLAESTQKLRRTAVIGMIARRRDLHMTALHAADLDGVVARPLQQVELLQLLQDLAPPDVQRVAGL